MAPGRGEGVCPPSDVQRAIRFGFLDAVQLVGAV
jgi:hypothetical protein